MIFSAKKVSPVVHSSSPFQQSSPVIIDSLRIVTCMSRQNAVVCVSILQLWLLTSAIPS